MVAKGRFTSPCKHGEASPLAKLTAEQVLAIYDDIRRGVVIAREYGIHYNTVRLIKRGEIWKKMLAAA